MYTHTLSFTTEEFYLATDVQALKRLLDSYRTMNVHYCLHWQELTKHFITKAFLVCLQHDGKCHKSCRTNLITSFHMNSLSAHLCAHAY